MSAPVSTFLALTTPLLDGDNRITSWTWQQKFIEWEQRTTTADALLVNGAPLPISATYVGTNALGQIIVAPIPSGGGSSDFGATFMLMGA